MKRIGSRTNDRWLTHVRQWKSCTRCPLGHLATHHVLGRGVLPCEVLLIGEAPGKDEDATGEPFIGRAGGVLDAIIEAVPITDYAITNALACAPWEDSGRKSTRAPAKFEMEFCYSRIEDFFRIASPKKVIFLGKVAEKFVYPSIRRLPPCPACQAKSSRTRPDRVLPEFLSVFHPAYIARKGGANSLEFKRVVLRIRRFVNQTQEAV